MIQTTQNYEPPKNKRQLFLPKRRSDFGKKKILKLKQLFDAKVEIERLSSLSVPKIIIVRHVQPG